MVPTVVFPSSPLPKLQKGPAIFPAQLSYK